MTIYDFIKKFAKETPDKISLIGDREITYEELYEKIVSFSNSIQNISNQSVITLMFENSEEFVISYLGTICSGKIAHLVSPNITKNNLETQLKSANPKLIISSKQQIHKLRKFELTQFTISEFENMFKTQKVNELRNPRNGDFSYLIYTSGTTSQPKGVAITHEQSMFTTNNIIKILKYNNSDVNLVPLPFVHSFGLGCLQTSIMTGGSLLIEKNTIDIENIFNLVKKYNVTTFAAVPATLTSIVKNHRKKAEMVFSELRLIMTNSTSVPITTVRKFNEILKCGNLATYYGLTEASRSSFMIFEKNLGKETSVGKPAPDVEIKIVNEDNNKNGNIWIKGKNVIKKYWENPEADKKIVNEWLNTGDLGFFDSDGYLYLTGRIDDLINVAGQKVNPKEIEKIVKDIPEVEEVIAIGKENKIFGNTIKLFVQRHENSNIKKTEIIAYCIKNLERYKVPTSIEFIDKFPRTDYGKIKRFMLE